MWSHNRRNKNDYIVSDDRIELILRNKNGEETARSLVDIEDLSEIRKHKWQLHLSGYVFTRIQEGDKRKHVSLHRKVFKKKLLASEVIDHVNRNPLDNRKSNLRSASRSQNKMNTEKILCIFFNQEKRRWKTTISVEGRRIYLGSFKERNAALKARRDAERKYFGEFAVLYQLNP